MEKEKIYVVEDNNLVRHFLGKKLRRETEYEVITFENAENCLESVENEEPSIVLLDFYLDSENPYNMNGHHAYNFINENYRNVDVVFMSSDNNLELMEIYNKYMNIKYLLKNDMPYLISSMKNYFTSN